MRTPHVCPCCLNNLLRHIGGGRIYWFCSSCYQEMPVLETLSDRQPALKFGSSKTSLKSRWQENYEKAKSAIAMPVASGV